MTTSTDIALPMGNEEKAVAACAEIRRREAEILAEIEAVEVTADNWNGAEVRDAMSALGDAVEDIRERGKRAVAEVCARTELQRVLTQIDSRLWSFKAKADPNCTYVRLQAAYKTLKAKVDAFRDAATPPKPTHTYILAVTLTDKALDAVFKAVGKAGGEVCGWCAPQTDKAVAKFRALIAENVTA